jgi:putative PIN family toxin of toxin-antitoxin system
VIIRLVFDTNLFVAAALNPSGYASRWLLVAGKGDTPFKLYSSSAIRGEVFEKLTGKFSLPVPKVAGFLARLSQVSTEVTPTERVRGVLADEDDHMVLECAVAAQARLIVTFDEGLLQLKEFHGIGIMHPHDLQHIFPSVSDLDSVKRLNHGV